MSPERRHKIEHLALRLMALAMIIGFAAWLGQTTPDAAAHPAGRANLSLGVMLLSAHVAGQILKGFGLPLLSGYLLAGILAGPHGLGFLSRPMVADMRLLDDLALGFIALAAGEAFDLAAVKRRRKSVILNIVLQTVVIFLMVFGFMALFGGLFEAFRPFDPARRMAIAILLGVTAVARSPSSAIAIISECRARGDFTSTALGVTVAIDVLIIILFTLAMTAVRMLFSGDGGVNLFVFGALSLEIGASIAIGAASGKLIAGYIRRAGHDLPLFLLFFAFGVAKSSEWLRLFMEVHHGFSLHLEPLIVCMSAGFVIRNLCGDGREGGETAAAFGRAIKKVSLPVYVLFFSLAGAGIDLGALARLWPLALCLAGVRALGLFMAAWLGGTLAGDPPAHNRVAWMAYLTQAGVAIGLAQLAMRQYPEFGAFLTTVVLAVIAVNQVAGPIAFKMALYRTGEAEQEGAFPASLRYAADSGPGPSAGPAGRNPPAA